MIKTTDVTEKSDDLMGESSFRGIRPVEKLSISDADAFWKSEMGAKETRFVIDPETYNYLLSEAFNRSEESINIDFELDESILSRLKEFNPQNWEVLSLDSKYELMRELIKDVGDRLGLPAIPGLVIQERDNGEQGWYDERTRVIGITAEMLNDPKELVDTLMHELRHAYQHYRAEQLQNFDDARYAVGLENYIAPVPLPYRGTLFFEDYRNQFVEVHKVRPGGKGLKYGHAYGFYYRNGERADSSDIEACCWCKKNDKEPQEIPNSGCGSWALLNIIGEPTSEAIKVMGLDDTLDFGKYKGKKLSEVIINDWQYVKWAVLGSQRLFVDIEEIVAFHEENMPRLTPADKMTFGKYKDRTLQEVYNEDQQYLRWLEDNNSSFRVDWNLFS